jgi:hypothetical protein
MECYLPTPPSKEPRISVLNSFKLEYTEADHVMIIPVDLRRNTQKPNVEDMGSWDYPYQADALDEDKQSQILGNVYEYLKLEGYLCEKM